MRVSKIVSFFKPQRKTSEEVQQKVNALEAERDFRLTKARSRDAALDSDS